MVITAVPTQQSYRVLWAQVVLQAKADLDNEPVGSLLFNQAAAFFVSRGEWAESRAIVADCLEMHPDDLCRCGTRWIAERREREGLEPEPPRAPRSKTPLVLPRLEALPPPTPNGGSRAGESPSGQSTRSIQTGYRARLTPTNPSPAAPPLT
jgi:hypothetical protein